MQLVLSCRRTASLPRALLHTHPPRQHLPLTLVDLGAKKEIMSALTADLFLAAAAASGWGAAAAAAAAPGARCSWRAGVVRERGWVKTGPVCWAGLGGGARSSRRPAARQPLPAHTASTVPAAAGGRWPWAPPEERGQPRRRSQFGGTQPAGVIRCARTAAAAGQPTKQNVFTVSQRA